LVLLFDRPPPTPGAASAVVVVLDISRGRGDEIVMRRGDDRCIFLGYFLHKYKIWTPLKFKSPQITASGHDNNIHYEIVQTLYIPPIYANWTNYILHAGKVSGLGSITNRENVTPQGTHTSHYVVLRALSSVRHLAAWNVHVGLNQLLPLYSTSKDVDDMPPAAAAAAQHQQQQWTTSTNDTPVPREERTRNDNNNRQQQRQQHRPIPNPNQAASTAPLFYHVSPGSTGSRSLYFATWVWQKKLHNYFVFLLLTHTHIYLHFDHSQLYMTCVWHSPYISSNIIYHVHSHLQFVFFITYMLYIFYSTIII
jgi:hypothetical protein